MSLAALYFCAYGALGAFFPFLPLLLAGRGFTADRIAWVMVLLPLFNLLAPPLWGVAADLLRARVRLLALAATGGGLSLLTLLPRWGIGGTLGSMALHCFFRAPLPTLADAISHSVLGEQRERFSRIRVWGSVGFAVAVATMGSLAASARPGLLLLSSGAILLCAALATIGLRQHDGPAERPAGIGGALSHLRQGATLLFLAATTCYYVGHATYDAFFSLHLHQELGLDDAFIGLAWAVGVTAEVGVMLVAHRLVRHHAALLVLCAAIAAARWWALATLSHPAWLLALQPLHAITFGLWYLSMVKQVQEGAPEHLRASHQSLATAAMGVGMIFGYLVGGRVMRAGGSHWLFRFASGAAALSGLLYVLAGRSGQNGARSAVSHS